MKPRIRSMIWNIRKQKTEQEEKKNPTKRGQAKESLGQLQTYKHPNHRGARGEEKEQEIGNLLEKKMKENFPNLVKEINMHAQEAQSPKQDGCRQAHSKTHHNQDARA